VITADLLHSITAAFDGIVSTAAFIGCSITTVFQGLFQSLRPGGWLQAQCGGGQNIARLTARIDVPG